MTGDVILHSQEFWHAHRVCTVRNVRYWSTIARYVLRPVCEKTHTHKLNHSDSPTHTHLFDSQRVIKYTLNWATPLYASGLCLQQWSESDR